MTERAYARSEPDVPAHAGHWKRHVAATLWFSYVLTSVTLATATTLCVTFGHYMSYDDEGYMLMFAKKLLAGGRLYDDVFGQYGPMFALWKATVHGLFGVPLSHAGVRWETVALVIASLILIAGGVYKLTGSKWAGALALLVCQRHVLYMAQQEPGHPQFLCLLLFLLAVWLAGAAAQHVGRIWLAVAAGALVALLGLTKVNAGLYLAAALLTWRAIPWTQARSARVGVLCAAGVAVQLALFRGNAQLWNSWSWTYWLVSSLSLTGVVVTSAVWCGRRSNALRQGWLLAGAVAASAVPIVWTLGRGTSLSGLVDGVLLQPLRLASHFFVSVSFSPNSIALTVLGALVAIVLARRVQLEAPSGAGEAATLGLMKLGFGAFVVWQALAAPSLSVLALGPAGLWLMVATDDRHPEPGRALELRVLAALAVAWQVLYAYPVAGSQVGYVAALVGACGVVYLRDGLRWLATCLGGRRRLSPVLGPALAALALGMVLVAQARGAAARWSWYQNRQPLDLKGAQGVRLAPRWAGQLQQVTDLITRSGCTHLISFPGMFSFNFWSGVDSPTNVNITTWMILPAPEQRRLIKEVEQAGSSCVLTNEQVERGVRREDVMAHPLGRWLSTRLSRKLGRVGAYKVQTTTLGSRPGPESGMERR